MGKFRLNMGTIELDLTQKTPCIKHDTTNKPLTSMKISDRPTGMISILKEFGPQFKRMSIIVDFTNCSQSTIEEFATYVTKYCSNSVQYVRFLGHSSSNRLSFPNATSIGIFDKDYLPTYELPPMDLNSIFPRMEKLFTTNTFYLQLDQHFPHLMHFEMNAPERDRNLKDFIRLNSQLRFLRMPSACNFTYLHEIDELLPNLETLEIPFWLSMCEYPTNGSSIRFRNVKKMSIDLTYLFGVTTENIHNSLSLLEFEQLESFKLTTFQIANSSFHFVIHWLSQYKTLTNVEFDKLDLDRTNLVRMSSELKQLKSVALYCSKTWAPREIKRFLMGPTNLKKVTISTCEGKPRECFEVDSLAEKWKVVGKRQIRWREELILADVKSG